MKSYVFDIETDGIDASKIHCLSYHDIETGDVGTLTTYEQMKTFVTQADLLVGHNIIRYDIPVIKRILGVDYIGGLVDTLGLSWYLWPNYPSHGLDAWGTRRGIEKPKVDNWDTDDIQMYIHRCEQDVKINVNIYEYFQKKLDAIYKSKPEYKQHLIDHLNFKLDCAREQEEVKWKLDVGLCERMVQELTKVKQERTQELKKHMPKNPMHSTHAKPKVIYKQDGTLSAAGERWFKRLKEHKLPMTHSDPVRYVDRYEEPNPGSTPQVKDWLFSLGWEPKTFDYKKNNEGEERAIPQVRNNGELCESVLELAEDYPEVKLLEGLTVVNHRLAIFNNMLKYQKHGYLTAGVIGLTNTLRFRHANPLVNLPGVDKPYGKEVRGALVANKGELLCGADLTSLEATTKAHFIYPHDPEYAKELTEEDFDEHLDLAVQNGELSREDYEYYQKYTGDERHKTIHKVRKMFKPVNYSAVYGIGKEKLSREIGKTQKETKALLDAYWERNHAVKTVADPQNNTIVYLRNGEMWLWNPIAHLFYSLRYEKDIFSTLNQGTGAFVFDTWVKHARGMGIRFCGQFHDEHISPVTDGKQDEHQKKLQEALDKTNEELMLNVEIGMDCQFGNTYAEIH